MIFIKHYIEGNTLHQSATDTLQWTGGSYIWELFSQDVYDQYNMAMFEGDVEIDESLFGRKVTYRS